MDLSVIIVNYNVRHFLEQCLFSVRKACEGISSESIVVDNNSADGSCSMVTMNFPEVKLLRNSKNTGFSAACNQAIKISSGRFILLLNPDTVVEEDTFKRCITFMEDHSEAGAIGVKMIDGNGRFLPESKRSLPTPSTAFFKMIGLSAIFPKSALFNRYYLGHLDNSRTTEADILTGAFMFIRKSALEKTGLLDETYFMYGEDIDLSYRLINAGYKNYYYADARIIHYKGESTIKGDINYIVHFYRAMLIFIGSHFGKKENGVFLLLIRIAIYFWGFIALLKNLLHRYILPVAGNRSVYNPFNKAHKVVIVSDSDGFGRISGLINKSGSGSRIKGRVSLASNDLGNEVMGSLGQLPEIIRVNRIDEVIFSAKELTASQIIGSMQLIADSNVKIRISPSGEKLIIGSNYVNE